MILLLVGGAVLLIACILAIAFYCYRTRGKTGNQNRFAQLSVVTEKQLRQNPGISEKQPPTPNEKIYREKKELKHKVFDL
jgi:hypothetical protein